jgi:hypothetical protein
MITTVPTYAQNPSIEKSVQSTGERDHRMFDHEQ